MIRVSPSTVAQIGGRTRSMMVLAGSALTVISCGGCFVLHAQTQSTCGADGYRVVARSWDALLKRGWESRQECDHPDWPLRLMAAHAEASDAASQGAAKNLGRTAVTGSIEIPSPLLVKAGDVVRLWTQSAAVRIEMSGVVERSAHQGEQVMVQITRQDDETGRTVQRIAGTVSGTGEVEMAR